jgi:hypothetical protein
VIMVEDVDYSKPAKLVVLIFITVSACGISP